MDITLILFIVIFGGIILTLLIVLILYLIAKSKGKITINLDKLEYSPGEKITGSLTLKLKNPQQANALNVGLIGTMRTRSYSNKRSDTRHRNIFEFIKPISVNQSYPAGESTYKFDIAIPRDVFKQTTGNQVADTLIKSAQLLGGVSSSVSWYVLGSLDIKGFDISKKVRINII